MEPADILFLRQQMGLTQAQLAEELGVTRVTVAYWERGRTPIRRIVVLALRYLAMTRPTAVRSRSAWEPPVRQERSRRARA
jgi:transcriptional regulator with XRE-family HTH domain